MYLLLSARGREWEARQGEARGGETRPETENRGRWIWEMVGQGHRLQPSLVARFSTLTFFFSSCFPPSPPGAPRQLCYETRLACAIIHSARHSAKQKRPAVGLATHLRLRRVDLVAKLQYLAAPQRTTIPYRASLEASWCIRTIATTTTTPTTTTLDIHADHVSSAEACIKIERPTRRCNAMPCHVMAILGGCFAIIAHSPLCRSSDMHIPSPPRPHNIPLTPPRCHTTNATHHLSPPLQPIGKPALCQKAPPPGKIGKAEMVDPEAGSGPRTLAAPSIHHPAHVHPPHWQQRTKARTSPSYAPPSPERATRHPPHITPVDGKSCDRLAIIYI